jgi:hypothetical protein
MPVALTAFAVAAAGGCSGAREGAPVDRFLERIAQHCGQAYAGRVVANEPAASNDPFVGQPLVMHVRECEAGSGSIRIPFHVGDDRSRTWVLTRTDQGLRLKHDHRHEDGTPDVVTMYGGETTGPGTAERQEFPADAESRALFEQQGLTASRDNVWALEIEPGRRMVYELTRPGREFRVEFDLTSAVPAPPPPWGGH